MLSSALSRPRDAACASAGSVVGCPFRSPPVGPVAAGSSRRSLQQGADEKKLPFDERLDDGTFKGLSLGPSSGGEPGDPSGRRDGRRTLGGLSMEMGTEKLRREWEGKEPGICRMREGITARVVDFFLGSNVRRQIRKRKAPSGVR